MSTSNRGRSVKCQANVVLEDGKCDNEIQTRILLAKEAFQNLINVLRNKISLLEQKRIVEFLCYLLLLVWQCILYKSLPDEEEAAGRKHVVL